MNTNLETLVQTLDAQDKSKMDYLVTPASGKVFFINDHLIMEKDGTQITYRPTDYFHQLASDKLKINKTYYDRMRNLAPELLASNVNWWLSKEDANMLLRTFEGEQNVAGALLSDRYSVMDNMEVLLETLDAVRKTGVHIEIKQADVTDTRMYLSVTAPEVEVQATEMLKSYSKALKAGSGVVSGFILTNSEVGAGAFNIKPRAVILACTNGLIMAQDSIKKVHMGARLDQIGMMANSDVKRANLNLIKEQVKHAVNTFLSKDYLQKVVNFYTENGAPEIQAPVNNIIQVIGKEYNITEARRESILNYFIKGGDMRRIGIYNAMTEELQDLKSPDLQYETEGIAHSVLLNFNKIERQAGNIAKYSNN